MDLDGLSGSLPVEQVRGIVRRALEEDLPWGDLTSEAFVPAKVQAVGRFLAKEDAIVCGLGVAAIVFEELDDSIQFVPCTSDGTWVTVGDVVAEVRGPARTILSGERTALNLMQRMSGIATTTARYVDAVAGTKAGIVDTRKTVPGLRLLDKYAVRCGGGSNHRFSLSDAVLVKDNHLSAIGGSLVSLADRLRSARTSIPHTVKMEVEVDGLDQIEPVLEGGVDIILLDNMTPKVLAEAVELIEGRALTEASGGITLDKVGEVARSGVDLISVGALTHSVHSVDISLEFHSRDEESGGKG